MTAESAHNITLAALRKKEDVSKVLKIIEDAADDAKFYVIVDNALVTVDVEIYLTEKEFSLNPTINLDEIPQKYMTQISW